MPYEETWSKTRCDKCKEVNWIYDGDLNDLTAPDTEAIECWNCSHKWWRDPDFALDTYGPNEDFEDEDSMTLEEHLNDLAVKGLKSPS